VKRADLIDRAARIIDANLSHATVRMVDRDRLAAALVDDLAHWLNVDLTPRKATR